jgi:hypothetical protein
MSRLLPPEPIPENCGAGVRIILGCGPQEDSYLLTHDFVSKTKTNHWNAIWPSLVKQLNNCSAKGRNIVHVTASSLQEVWFVSGSKPGVADHCWFKGVSKDQQQEITSAYKYDKSAISIMHHSRSSEYECCDDCSSYGYLNSSGQCSDCCPEDDVAFIVADNDRNFDYSSQHLNTELLDTIRKLHRKNERIKNIILGLNSSGAGYFIRHSHGSGHSSECFCDVGSCCEEQICNGHGGGAKEVAVGPDGSWVVVKDSQFFCSYGVPQNLQNELSDYFAKHRHAYNKREREIEAFHHQQHQLAQEAMRVEAAARAQKQREIQLAIVKKREEEKLLQRMESERKQAEKRKQDELNVKKRKADVLQTELKTLQQQISQKNNQLLQLGVTPPTPSSSTASSSISSSQNTLPNCIICDDGLVNMILLPCNHVCVCEGCCTALFESGHRNCPVCRAFIVSKNKVYISGYSTNESHSVH